MKDHYNSVGGLCQAMFEIASKDGSKSCLTCTDQPGHSLLSRHDRLAQAAIVIGRIEALPMRQACVIRGCYGPPQWMVRESGILAPILAGELRQEKELIHMSVLGFFVRCRTSKERDAIRRMQPEWSPTIRTICDVMSISTGAAHKRRNKVFDAVQGILNAAEDTLRDTCEDLLQREAA